MSEWDIVTEAVTEHAVALRTMSTHGEIYKWAKDNDLTSRTLFPKLKAQLRKQLGIDYEQLRESATEQRAEELAVAAAEAPQIVLWVAADAEAGSFAVCDSEERRCGTAHSIPTTATTARVTRSVRRCRPRRKRSTSPGRPDVKPNSTPSGCGC